VRTLAEAVEEFAGLENEVQAWLDALSILAPDREHHADIDVARGAVLLQLVEVAYSALWSCEEYQARMRVAIHALQNGVSEGSNTPEVAEGTPEGS